MENRKLTNQEKEDIKYVIDYLKDNISKLLKAKDLEELNNCINELDKAFEKLEAEKNKPIFEIINQYNINKKLNNDNWN